MAKYELEQLVEIGSVKGYVINIGKDRLGVMTPKGPRDVYVGLMDEYLTKPEAPAPQAAEEPDPTPAPAPARPAPAPAPARPAPAPTPAPAETDSDTDSGDSEE